MQRLEFFNQVYELRTEIPNLYPKDRSAWDGKCPYSCVTFARIDVHHIRHRLPTLMFSRRTLASKRSEILS
jgi:hypothetical protein